MNSHWMLVAWVMVGLGLASISNSQEPGKPAVAEVEGHQDGTNEVAPFNPDYVSPKQVQARAQGHQQPSYHDSEPSCLRAMKVPEVAV